MSITRLTTNGLSGTKYDTVSADNYYMEPIATTLLSSSAGSITFSNIPQNYKHLQVRGIMRSTFANAGVSGASVAFNGDTSNSNYSFHRLMGDGSGASGVTAYGVGSTFDFTIPMINDSATSNSYSPFVIDILDYSNVYKAKTMRCLNGADLNNSNGIVSMRTQGWFNTAPITSLTITPSTSNFKDNTRISVYGVKA
jgi:type V secretory pathway adhesin AidA